MTEPYALHAGFEQGVLYHLIFSSKIHRMIGLAIEPDAFSDPVRCLIARAALEIGRERRAAPGSEDLILQRIHRWSGEGTVAQDQVVSACEMLWDIVEVGSKSEDDPVITELLPILRERRNRKSLKQALQTMMSREPMTDVIQELQVTSRLGNTEMPVGTDLRSDATREEIRRMRMAARLSTGVDAIDSHLLGGPPPGTLSAIMSPPGGGKSMFLANLAARALERGLNVLIATLELSKEAWAARLISSITNIPVANIMDGSLLDEACDLIEANKVLGNAIIAYITQSTTVEELVDWVEEEERLHAWEADLLVVDYADLIGVKEVNSYAGLKHVYTVLRER
jgi:hypothetical protein